MYPGVKIVPGIKTGNHNNEDIRIGHEQVQIFERLAHRPRGLREWIIGQLLDSADELRVGGISIQDWHMAGWGVHIVSLKYALFLTAWLYFVVVLTSSGTTTQYLSLQGSDPDIQICQEIPRQVNLVAQGDIYGCWSTHSRYSINASAFEISFQGSNITTDQYVATMNDFRAQMKALSAKSSQRDAGWNAMFWATFELNDHSTQMSFYSTADATIIYEADWTMGALTSAASGMCTNSYQSGSYDTTFSRLKFSAPTKPLSGGLLDGSTKYSANGTHPAPGSIFRVDYINASWTGYDACPNQYPALKWRSWETSPYTNWMELSFDIRTAVSAISLNLQIKGFGGLYSTPPAFGAQTSGNIPGTWWADPIYIPMDPVFCVDKQALSDRRIIRLTKAQIQGPPLCFLVDQTRTTPVFYYPVTVSMYVDDNGIPRHCECPRDQLNAGCNARNYLFAFFYETERNLTRSIEFALILQKFLIDDPLNGDKNAQDYLYPFLASTWYTAPPAGFKNAKYPSFLNASINNKELHTQLWHQLCPWGTCGAAVFSSSKDETVSAFLPLNKYNFQARDSPANNRSFGKAPNALKQEMCVNTVYSDAMFDNFIAEVPSPFVQPYFQCQKRTFAAFQDAAGNAAGIAGGLSAFAILLFGFLFKAIQNYRASHQTVKERTVQPELEKESSRVRIGDRRFQIGENGGGMKSVQRLNPSLMVFRHKERLIDRLKDAKDESLLMVIESLVENSQKQREENRALMQQVQQQHVLLQQLLGAGSNGNGEGKNELLGPQKEEEGSNLVGENRNLHAQNISNIPSQTEKELIERLGGLRELFEFDVDEAQLLSEMERAKKKRTNN